MSIRKMIQIDEEKCTGCGQCIIDCAEGALKIIDGKAKVIKDSFCDGLGACIGGCPEGALTIIEREADAFDEEAVEIHLKEQEEKPAETMACGCSGSMLRTFEPCVPSADTTSTSEQPSLLTQWPVQLRLLPPSGSLYKNKPLMLIADCVGVSDPNLHQNLIKGNTIVLTCPKLDDMNESIDKLAEIFQSSIKSISCAIMEVPCCGGLIHIVKEARKKAGVDLPIHITKIGIKGAVLETSTEEV